MLNKLTTMPKWVKIVLILLVVTGLIWFGYIKYSTNKAAAVTYQTTTVSKGTLIISVTGSGQISTANSAAVTTTATGVVSKVYVKNDTVVRTGTPLVQIDLDLATQQKYQSALSTYKSAQNSLNSLQSSMYIANQKLINDSVARGLAWNDPTYIEQEADWHAAENNYLNQQLDISSAWLSLQQVSPIIYAPISGTVTGLALQSGSVLTSAQKIASIKTGANPVLTLNLTEIDAPKIRVGDKATITLDSLTGTTYTGKVVSVDTVGTVSSGVTTYPTTIVFDTKPTEILSNMAAAASVVIDSKADVLIVPIAAVKTTNNQAYVQVLKNGKPQNVNVGTGLSSDTSVEITSGIAEGDEVVTSTTSTAVTTTGTTSVFSSLGGNRGFGGAAVRRN